MARFQFKLQKVLETRLTFEDLAKRRFGEAVREVRKQEEIRDDLIRQRENHLNDMADRRKLPSTVVQFSQDIQYEWMLKMKIRRQNDVVTKVKQKMEKRRRELVEAIKERKIMENLRQKQFDEFRKLQKKDDIKFADEIAGRKAHFETSPITGE